MDQRGDTRLTTSEMTSLRALGWHGENGHDLDAERDEYPPLPLDAILPLDPRLVENGTAVDLPVP